MGRVSKADNGIAGHARSVSSEPLKEPGTESATGPLAGVFVVDVTEGAQGPWAGALLADLGAYVVKVEKPGGELMRRTAPFKRGRALPNIGLNHGKANVVLDLKNSEQDRSAILSLISQADVFMENWRPGVARRLGVGYSSLREVNPEIVYLSASGLGQEGIYAAKRCGGPIAEALGGYFHTTGPYGGLPELPRFVVADFSSPLAVCQGILLGLLARSRFGTGQWVQCSQLATTVSISAIRFVEYAMRGTLGERMGSECSWMMPSGAFRCADTYIVFECPTTETWIALCDAIGLPMLTSDSRFVSNAERVSHREELASLLEARLVERRGAHWLSKLLEHGVPCSEIRWDIEELYDDADILAEGLVAKREDPRVGTIRTNAVPWNFSETPAVYGDLAHDSDADRASVLRRIAPTIATGGGSR